MIAHTDIETAQSAFEITINMGLRDLDSIWTTYYKMTTPTMPSPNIVLNNKIPEVKPYDIDTASYDSLIKGAWLTSTSWAG